jgi:hypothetical protein
MFSGPDGRPTPPNRPRRPPQGWGSCRHRNWPRDAGSRPVETHRRPGHSIRIIRSCESRRGLRSHRKRPAPPLQDRLRFREGGRCPPANPLPLQSLTSQKGNHRLATLRRRPRHDLEAAAPLGLLCPFKVTGSLERRLPSRRHGSRRRHRRPLGSGRHKTLPLPTIRKSTNDRRQQPKLLRVAGKGAILGVRGLTLCPNDFPAPQPVAHIVIPGTLGRRDDVCSPGAEGGRGSGKPGADAGAFIGPVRHTISRTRDPCFFDTDGQAGRPPPQSAAGTPKADQKAGDPESKPWSGSGDVQGTGAFHDLSDTPFVLTRH